MKKLFLILLATALTGMVKLNGQIVLDDITLPGTFTVKDTKLVLNGGGIREKWFLDVYVGGLYLKEKTRDAQAVINADEPMAVRLVIVSSLVSSSKMSSATREGFEKATDNNTKPIEQEIEKFISIFEREPIVKGDVFDLVYEPGDGVNVYKNNKYQDTIKGMKFKRALFGIWLSDDPVDSDLKEGMLDMDDDD